MVAANPSMLANAAPVRQYGRVQLLNPDGTPLKASSLAANRAYIFHYPFVTTPCFLINIGKPLSAGHLLKTENEGSYAWQGGAGPEKSLVSFSAICAHKFSYPTKTLSFLNYRTDNVRFEDLSGGVKEKTQLIYCCSERSAYDPAKGAEVIGGPARQPLAAIELEYDAETDGIYAIGSRGGELYEPFFERFGFRLALDHEIEDVKAPVKNSTTVFRHEEYSQHAVSC